LKRRVLIFCVNNYNTTCNIILPNKTACHCLPHDVESHLSSVQNPLTIPVNSHSLSFSSARASAMLPRLGFGFRGEVCDGWHFRGASATIRLQGYVLCALPIMTLIMHKRFRGASAKGLSILSSARPSAVLPRLQFQLPRRYCRLNLSMSLGYLVANPSISGFLRIVIAGKHAEKQ
jgi:hypothetical protein